MQYITGGCAAAALLVAVVIIACCRGKRLLKKKQEDTNKIQPVCYLFNSFQIKHIAYTYLFGRSRQRQGQNIYRPQGKVMFSQASVILSTIGPMATRSLLILVTVRLVRILLECFLVLSKYEFNNTFQTLDTNDVRTWQFYPSDRVPSTGYVYPDGEAPEKQPPSMNKVQH